MSSVKSLISAWESKKNVASRSTPSTPSVPSTPSAPSVPSTPPPRVPSTPNLGNLSDLGSTSDDDVPDLIENFEEVAQAKTRAPFNSPRVLQLPQVCSGVVIDSSDDSEYSDSDDDMPELEVAPTRVYSENCLQPADASVETKSDNVQKLIDEYSKVEASKTDPTIDDDSFSKIRTTLGPYKSARLYQLFRIRRFGDSHQLKTDEELKEALEIEDMCRKKYTWVFKHPYFSEGHHKDITLTKLQAATTKATEATYSDIRLVKIQMWHSLTLAELEKSLHPVMNSTTMKEVLNEEMDKLKLQFKREWMQTWESIYNENFKKYF